MTEFDKPIKPTISDDFYSHVNWDWLQSNPIPSEYTKWGNFHVLMEQNQFRLKEMLESQPESDEQHKLNTLWTQGLDSVNLNYQGHLHIKSLFTKFKLDASIDTYITELMK
jgi:putative endopeptidase